MTGPDYRPSVAASETERGPEGADTGGRDAEALAAILVEHLCPEQIDPAYRAEFERGGMRLPDPVDQSCMVTFADSDGHRSIRPLAFGEVADAVLAAGYGLVSEANARNAEIRALEAALEAARGHARVARSEGLDRETCRFWQGTAGWLRSRISKLAEGVEPDWPDAARSGPQDQDES